MMKREDDLMRLDGGSFTGGGRGPVSGGGNLTAETLKSKMSKMENLLKGTFPPHQVYGGDAVFGENFLDHFGSPSPRLSSVLKFLRDSTMIGITSNLMGGSGGPGLLPFRIIESHLLIKKEQYFFPKSKKKRILKKCAKKYVRQVPDLERAYFVNNNTIICHPVFADILRRTLKRIYERGDGFSRLLF